jgi:hypothetical protein
MNIWTFWCFIWDFHLNNLLNLRYLLSDSFAGRLLLLMIDFNLFMLRVQIRGPFRLNTSKVEVTLWFQSLDNTSISSITDAGIYECQISTEPKDSVKVHLTIVGKSCILTLGYNKYLNMVIFQNQRPKSLVKSIDMSRLVVQWH